MKPFVVSALSATTFGFLEQFEKHDVYGKSTFANALPAGELEPDVAEILGQFLGFWCKRQKDGIFGVNTPLEGANPNAEH